MSDGPYSERVLRLFRATQHAGGLAGAPCARGETDEVRIELSARVGSGGQLEALRFRAWGCPHVVAACEALCAALEGGPASRLGEVRAAELVTDLPVPTAKTGRILVLEDVAHSLGQKLRDDPRST